MRCAAHAGRAVLAGLFLTLASVSAPVAAQQRLDDAEALRISQAAIGRVLGGYTLTDSSVSAPTRTSSITIDAARATASVTIDTCRDAIGATPTTSEPVCASTARVSLVLK